jgi:hypothetical protein
LKQVLVNFAVMGWPELTGRQGLVGPQRGHFKLEGVEPTLPTNIRFVF